MSRAETKANRLLQIEVMLLEHPEGLTQSEIARRLGVHRSTVNRYIPDLPGHVYINDLDGNRWKIDREAYLVRVRFNLHEALAVHLASRLLATRMDRQNPHAAAALRKLAVSLERLAPRISRHLGQSADVMDDINQRHDPIYLQVLEKLTLAWAEERKARVWHRQEKTGRVYEYVFSPYFIEPYAVGQSTHTIGFREPPGKTRTFKIERVERVELLRERYTIPDDFDPRDLLADAWGIWYTESEPVEVLLRFHPRVANRVRETRWHRSERIEEQPDGYLLWRGNVAEPQEMLPWIRGWGADCEVLEPEKLQKVLSKEARQMAKIYDIDYAAARLPFQIPYAKTNRVNPDEIHLLLYHLVDVGRVALIMWQDVLTDSIRQRLAEMLNLTVGECGLLFSFLSALHDLGKAGPAYQKKYAPNWLKKELTAAGLNLEGMGRAYDKTFPHGTVTTWALDTFLPEMLGLDERFAHKIATALGGHHGIWPRPGATDQLKDDQNWDSVRRDLVWELLAVFTPPKDFVPPTSIAEQNTFFTILSGLVSVADWVGSRNTERFDFIDQPMSTRRYVEQSKEKAKAELTELGWVGWQPKGEIKTFTETFAYLDFDAPRDTQLAVIDAASDLVPPTLLILEAPTGLGKTETALYLADLWLQQFKGRGLYIAMPTQATSNQMFGRTKEYLKQRFPHEMVNLHLVHGQTNWSDQLKEIELQSVGDIPSEGVAAMSWFKPRKRTLLAPFGVGTVDQTLMSILQTKHFFVRIFGLAHKVVIFDEVHAYDTYMNTLFHRLLEWLNAIGTSVIILSATLPAKTRRELVKHYTGQDLPPTEPAYPALTIANVDDQKTIKLPEPESYTLQLDWSVGREPERIAEFLEKELANGGCAAVICNTVRRAQDVYRALRDAQIVPADDLILFHSRFPPVWRMGIEAKVLKKFEKNGKRPHKAIVFATQVIEQSLDIDFDLMITDLAPADLILQRAGRLHRHKGNERYGLPRRLVIMEPLRDDVGLPDFGSDKWVYAPYILMRSYLALHQRSQVSIPGKPTERDTIELIEAVYDESVHLNLPDDGWQEALQLAIQKLQNEERETRAKASQPLILEPTNRRLLAQPNDDLEEDDPTTHKAFRAQTRDIDFSITIVCLHRKDREVGIYDEDQKMITFDLEASLHSDLVQLLLKNSLGLQHRSVGKYFIEQQIPQGWQENAALRYVRYVIFDDGVCKDVPGYTLLFSPELGLEIIKLEDK